MMQQIWLVLRNFFVIIGMFTVAMIAFKLSRGELEFAPIFGSRPVPAPGITVPTPGADDRPRVETMNVVVNSNRYADEILTLSGNTLRPSAGKTFLICDLTVNYEGSREESVGLASFRMVSQNRLVYGSTYPGNSLPRDFQLLSAVMVKGGRATGSIVFEVEPGTAINTVSYAAASRTYLGGR